MQSGGVRLARTQTARGVIDIRSARAAQKLVVELDHQVKEGGQKVLTNLVRAGRLATDNEIKGFDVLEGTL